jgi:hypothetical protein
VSAHVERIYTASESLVFLALDHSTQPLGSDSSNKNHRFILMIIELTCEKEPFVGLVLTQGSFVRSLCVSVKHIFNAKGAVLASVRL